MPYYRLYHIQENRFIGVDNFSAEDDGQAIRDARRLEGKAATELWEGGRRIATFHPKVEAPYRSGALTSSLSAR